MTVNLFGRSASFARSAARIAKVFGTDQVWHLTPTREGNTIVVAARGVEVRPARCSSSAPTTSRPGTSCRRANG
ncbi:hypothetical protein [Mitsuaria sp. TWR114]|uniref:hypothetical protein n=1 Tax=Mitsuaria sp. TWR114 TaxID=2601731 RepID=UPI0038577DB3